MDIEIRPLRKKDKIALTQLLRSTPEFNSDDCEVAEELIANYLKDPDNSGYHVFIAEADGTVDGYICYGPTPLTQGTWDIYWISVRAESQGRGIGGTLLAFAEDNIRKAQGRLSMVETSGRPEYERARRLYLKSGYEIVSEVEDFYAPGDSKIILRKRLT